MLPAEVDGPKLLADLHLPVVAHEDAAGSPATSPSPIGEAAPLHDDAPRAALVAMFMSLAHEAVAASSAPVLLLTMSHRAQSNVSELVVSEWGGAGGIGNLLRRGNDPSVAVLRFRTGYAYDPARHDPATVGAHFDATEQRQGEPGDPQVGQRRLARRVTVIDRQHRSSGAPRCGSSSALPHLWSEGEAACPTGCGSRCIPGQRGRVDIPRGADRFFARGVTSSPTAGTKVRERPGPLKGRIMRHRWWVFVGSIEAGSCVADARREAWFPLGRGHNGAHSCRSFFNRGSATVLEQLADTREPDVTTVDLDPL